MTEKEVKRLEAALEEEQEMADDPEALLDSIEVGRLVLWSNQPTSWQAIAPAFGDVQHGCCKS